MIQASAITRNAAFHLCTDQPPSLAGLRNVTEVLGRPLLAC
jgi:hypothetical protein